MFNTDELTQQTMEITKCVPCLRKAFSFNKHVTKFESSVYWSPVGMYDIFIYLLVTTLGVSGSQTFYYKKFPEFRRISSPCGVCYGVQDCVTLEQVRCELYLGTDGILRPRYEDPQYNDVNPELKAEVDNLMLDMVEEVTTSTLFKDCVPFVSQYTDCTKDNVCIGCKTCECDSRGEWNCSQVQRCRVDSTQLNVDHRTLVRVMENLMHAEGDISPRIRRSIQHENKKQDTKSHKLNFEEISEWLYGVKPVAGDNDNNLRNIKELINTGDVTGAVHTVTKRELITQQSMTESVIPPDHDYLAFDEVLTGIAVDTKNNNRRKLPMGVVHSDPVTDIDYMTLDEDNITNEFYNRTDPFMDTLRAIEGNEDTVTESTVEGVTKFVIDLLESAKINNENEHTTEYLTKDIKWNIEESPIFDNINNAVNFDVRNIMKRDVSYDINNTNATEVSDYGKNNNVSLKDNVLLPLVEIINDKEKELKELIRIKENLNTIMKTNKTDAEIHLNENTTQTAQTVNNTVFSIYKLDLFPQFQYDLRRNNLNLSNKLMYKLKRDIYEVIRDIVAIQKFSDSPNLPDDLRVLIRAMKYYVRAQKKILNKENDNLVNINKKSNRRRHWSSYLQDYGQNFVKKYILDILGAIDKQMTESNALAPISPITRKILKRIIKKNYVNDFAAIGLTVYDPHYNFTNDLKVIGRDVQKMTADISDSPHSDILYTMKLLHFILSVDISKMTDALALLNFAHSRRMIPLGSPDDEQLTYTINKGLKDLNDKIQLVMQYHSQKAQVENNVDVKNAKKESFLKRIKNFFKGSKRDIADMMHNNVTKSEIVKELTRKKLNEINKNRLSEYEEKMRSWPNESPIRNKRSLLKVNQFNHRMKNIIPKYLRGKVNPAIAAKGKSNSKRGLENIAIKKKKIPTTTAKAKIATVRLNKMKRKH